MNRTSLFEVTFIVVIGCLLLGRHGLGQELDQRKEIHLAASFPINGFEGWQGGQVRLFTYSASTLNNIEIVLKHFDICQRKSSYNLLAFIFI